MSTPACPRCRSEATTTVATSPVPGCWSIHTCSTCCYAWRSTEPATATDPEAFAPGFRIDPAGIPAMPQVPTPGQPRG